MHVITGGRTAALPDGPCTADGTSFGKLAIRAEHILDKVEEGSSGADAVALAYLASQVAELCTVLHALSRSELAVTLIFNAGRGVRSSGAVPL